MLTHSRLETAGVLELELTMLGCEEGGNIREYLCGSAQTGENGFLRGQAMGTVEGRKWLFPEIKPFRGYLFNLC